MLSHKVAIYIPSTIDGNKPASPEVIEKWTRASKIMLANLFGGFTSHSGQGGWYSPEHGLIEESVTIVAAFTDADGLDKVAKVKDLAKQIAMGMGQEAVSVEVDGALHFVTA